MTKKRGRKPGVRNKFKKVFLINGKPEILYIKKNRTIVKLSVAGKEYNLGAINTDLHDLLKKIPDSIVNIIKKETNMTQKIEGFKGLHIRKAGENTTIEVSAPTEKELALKIGKLKDYLESKNILVTERCNWICTVDKGKQENIKEEKEVKKLDENIKEEKKTDKKESGKKSYKHPTREEKIKEVKQLAFKLGLGNDKNPDYDKVRELNKSKK